MLNLKIKEIEKFYNTNSSNLFLLLKEKNEVEISKKISELVDFIFEFIEEIIINKVLFYYDELSKLDIKGYKTLLNRDNTYAMLMDIMFDWKVICEDINNKYTEIYMDSSPFVDTICLINMCKFEFKNSYENFFDVIENIIRLLSLDCFNYYPELNKKQKLLYEVTQEVEMNNVFHQQCDLYIHLTNGGVRNFFNMISDIYDLLENDKKELSLTGVKFLIPYVTDYILITLLLADSNISYKEVMNKIKKTRINDFFDKFKMDYTCFFNISFDNFKTLQENMRGGYTGKFKAQDFGIYHIINLIKELD